MLEDNHEKIVLENKKKKSVIYRRVLEKFGFDLDKPGYPLFVDLIDDLKNVFAEEIDTEEVKQLLPNYYIEHHHFVQAMGKYDYLGELQEFCNSGKTSEKIGNKVVGTLAVPNQSMDDTIVYFAKYFYPIIKECVGEEKSLKAVFYKK